MLLWVQTLVGVNEMRYKEKSIAISIAILFLDRAMFYAGHDMRGALIFFVILILSINLFRNTGGMR